MEEVRRVTTVRKPKKTTTILLVIVGFLGLALLGVALYFYTIGDSSKDTQPSQKSCACYYIDPAVISECGDPRRGFIFETKTVSEDTTCKASCSTNNLSTNLLNSSTQQDLYQICQLDSIVDMRCSEMLIKDSNGKIVTGEISADEKITVEATFDSEYANYKIIVNNEPADPDTTSTDKLTIKKTLSGFTTSSLNIVATGTDSSGEQINSPICRKLIDVNLSAASTTNDLVITTRTADGVFKISGMTIGVGNITEDTTLSITFSFDTGEHANLTMQKGFTLDTSKGEITILEKDLYDPSNFSVARSFSDFDSYVGEVKITAELKNTATNTIIGTVSKTITFPEKKELEEEKTPAEESSFQVTNTGDISCIERVTPNNRAQFTLTATNHSTVAQTIVSIKDKLPLGFTYIDGSTKINGVAVEDGDYVTKTNIGDTIEIVWKKGDGWSLSSGQSLTISFQSEAGANALTGKNQNEVVITPSQIPTDPSQLSTEYVILVAQDCDNPEGSIKEEETPSTPQTGIFDSTLDRVIIGLMVVILGWYVYNRPFGQIIAKKFVDSGVYKEAEMTSLKIFNPKKYFEEKTIKKLSKKRKVS